MFKINKITNTIFILLLVTVFSVLAETVIIGEPILRINTDMHTDAITSIDIDKNEYYLVTGSKDRTVRVWSLPEEWDKDNLAGARLERVLRPPINKDTNEGQINAVAISPDGTEIIAGGWSGCHDDMDMGCSIYIFNRATGKLKKRISRLPAEVLHLAYSPEGGVFLATLGTKGDKAKGEGIRIYRTSTTDYRLEEALEDCKEASHWAEIFDDPNDNKARRMVTTCKDGLVRLYDKGFNLIAEYKVDEGKSDVYPYMARFHPSGTKIAVGLKNSTKILLLSAKSSSLRQRVPESTVPKADKDTDKDKQKQSPDEQSNNNSQNEYPKLKRLDILSLQANDLKGDLSILTWSKNGDWLYATGYHYTVDGVRPILRWYQGSSQNSYLVWPSIDKIIGFRALENGSIVFGAANPAFGVFDSRGQKTLHHDAEIADFNTNRYFDIFSPEKRLADSQSEYTDFLLSRDASTVQFGYSSQHGKRLVRFSIHNRTLSTDNLVGDEKLTMPRIDGVKLNLEKKYIQSEEEKELNGIYLSSLKLNNKPLKETKKELDKTKEIVSSFAVTSVNSAQRFLLGTNKFLRLFDKNGNQQWEKEILSTALQVNIAKNDKIAVAMLKDGTLRWYRLGDGEELLAFFPHREGKRWILWTPLGYYDASVGGEELIGWHVNLGPNKAADFFSASQFRKLYYRPDVVSKVLELLYVDEALFVANQETNMEDVTPEIRDMLLKKTYPPEVINTVLEMFDINKMLHLVAKEMGHLPEEQVDKRPIRELLPPVVAQLKKCDDKENTQVTNRDTKTINQYDSTPFSYNYIELCYHIRRPSDEYINALKVLVNGRPLGEIRKQIRSKSLVTRSIDKNGICTSLPKIRNTDYNQEAIDDNPETANNSPENSRNINNQEITQSHLNCELPQSPEIEHRLSITGLPADDIEVSLIVENKFAASDPISINLNWTGVEPTTPKPNLYVLAVGVSQYDDKDIRLKYAAQDAIDFVEAFKKQEDNDLYDKVKVNLLSDATKAKVLSGFKWIRKRATTNDVAIVFLAGHGYNDNEGKYYFLPRDVDLHNIKQTSVVYKQIKDTVTALRSKTLFFIDTCHSGNVMGSSIIKPVDVDQVSNDLSSSENGIVVFAAATGKQSALENDSWGNGAFTKAILEGLEGDADLIGNDGKIKFSELNTYLSDRVPTLTDNVQTPTTAIPRTIADFPIALTPLGMGENVSKRKKSSSRSRMIPKNADTSVAPKSKRRKKFK